MRDVSHDCSCPIIILVTCPDLVFDRSASVDSVRVIIYGKGGPGAIPKTTIDPVGVAAPFVKQSAVAVKAVG